LSQQVQQKHDACKEHPQGIHDTHQQLQVQHIVQVREANYGRLIGTAETSYTLHRTHAQLG
jgi:hypothetical protein